MAITPQEFEDGLGRHFPRGLGEDQEPPKARWARVSELHTDAWAYRPGAFFLGYRAGKAIGREDNRHVLLVAGSRGGKGVSIITPACLLWGEGSQSGGSLLAIDPKGELARTTARHRQHGLKQAVHVLDPFGVSGIPSASFNPLAEIDPDSPGAVDDAASIADALIVHVGGETHWTDAARELVKGVILYALTLPPDQRNLVTVRELLTLAHPLARPHAPKPGEKAAELDARMLENMVACSNNTASAIGRSMLATPERERASIFSSAKVQTGFLDSPALASTLRRSDFQLADLKRKRVSVYLCLPAGRMGTHARWLRVIINMALLALEITPGKPEPPVLLVLEEFNVLGHMASIATAAGQIAGFGVKLLTVLQDLTQLKRHYRDEWETFVGNAGLFIAFANSDATTLEYLSKKLGSISITVETQNAQTTGATLSGASGISTSVRTDPLLAPAEIEQAFARERERMLVLYAGGKPMILQRSISHEDENFREKIGCLSMTNPQATTSGGLKSTPFGFQTSFTQTNYALE